MSNTTTDLFDTHFGWHAGRAFQIMKGIQDRGIALWSELKDARYSNEEDLLVDLADLGWITNDTSYLELTDAGREALA